VTIDAHGCMVNLDNERCAFFMHTYVLNQSEDSCMIIQINILFKALMVLTQSYVLTMGRKIIFERQRTPRTKNAN